ncbi:MAG TPA: ABC transporter permease [Nocardioidaceae bacterium]|nr:ABC transporter permease [Nocardioidaceae bacterium]
MDVFVAWRDLVHARGRFALMTAVVVMITVLVGLLSGLTQGLGRESTSAVTGLATERLVFSGDRSSFASSRVPSSARIEGEPLGFATVRAQSGDRTTPVTSIGVEPRSSVAPDSSGVARGRVVLAEKAASELGAAPGDEVRIGTRELVVARVHGEASFSHTPVVWTDLADWQDITGAQRSATVVATADHVVVPAGYTSVPLAASVQAIGSYTSENGSLNLIRGFLLVISALVIGAFFTVWTIQRSRDIAVLKALGASTAYLLRDALGQAVVLLLGGTLVGALLVVVAGSLVSGRVPFVLDVPTLALPLAVLNLLGVAGAALAVRRVTSIDPLTALGSAR